MQFKKIYLKYLGSNDHSGKLVTILGSGVKVRPGDKIAEIETTKTIIEIHSEDAGFFYPSAKIAETIKVGHELGIISNAELDITNVNKNIASENEEFSIIITDSAKSIIEKYNLNINIKDFKGIIDSRVIYNKFKDIFKIKIKKCKDPNRDLIILGAGSAAELILEHINILGAYNVRYFVDYNDLPHRSHLFDIEVLGFNQLEELRDFGYANIFIHLPSAKKTHENMEYCINKGFKMINVIHPTASVSPTSAIGVNNLIGPHVVIGPYVTIGDCVSVLNCASVAHHSVIGNGVRVSDGARVAGNVKIGDFVLLGLNSTVNARVHIEREITVLSGKSVYESLEEPGINY